MKSQVSVEYLLIIGFVTLITIPLVFIFFKYTAETSNEIVNLQVNQIANKIVDAAESVYFLGEPSQITIRVSIPGHIVGVSLDNREVVFNVGSISGISEIVKVSSVDLTGDLPTTQGIYSITLKARSTGVEISYK